DAQKSRYTTLPRNWRRSTLGPSPSVLNEQSGAALPTGSAANPADDAAQSSMVNKVRVLIVLLILFEHDRGAGMQSAAVGACHAVIRERVVTATVRGMDDEHVVNAIAAVHPDQRTQVLIAGYHVGAAGCGIGFLNEHAERLCRWAPVLNLEH